MNHCLNRSNHDHVPIYYPNAATVYRRAPAPTPAPTPTLGHPLSMVQSRPVDQRFRAYNVRGSNTPQLLTWGSDAPSPWEFTNNPSSVHWTRGTSFERDQSFNSRHEGEGISSLWNLMAAIMLLSMSILSGAFVIGLKLISWLLFSGFRFAYYAVLGLCLQSAAEVFREVSWLLLSSLSAVLLAVVGLCL